MLTDSLQIVLINARSIRNKFGELRALIATEKIDIVAITETWIHASGRDFIGEFHIPTFRLFHRDRSDREGGGVALYVRDSLDPVTCKVGSEQEILGVDLTVGTGVYRFIVVYRPPHQLIDNDTKLYNEISELIGEKITVILGDFNCHVNWNDKTGDAEARRVIDFADEAFLTQWVTEPTRGENVLDLVFTTEDDHVSSLTVDEPLGGSDHNLIRFSLRAPKFRDKIQQHSRPDLRRADFNGLRKGVCAMHLELEQSVNESWCSFRDNFMAQQTMFVPYKTIGSPLSQPKWFTREIAATIRKRKIAYRKFKDTGNLVIKGDYNSLCRRVKSLVDRAKRDEELRIATLCKKNPKEFFGYVNSRKPIRNKIGPLRDANSVLRDSNHEIADILNSHFSSVFTREAGGNIPEPGITHDDVILENIQCTKAEVHDRLGNLNANKSPGPDEFLPRVMREVSAQVATHLAAIFNNSLAIGEVPSDWKEANVTPIFKKGDRKHPGNYRPISLTSVVGKVLEGIIADRIVDHLESNKLLYDSQHGFRQRRSCLTNLIEFFHCMLSEYDQCRAIDILYLDFQKAFDKVPHRRLMTKIRALGIQGVLAEWIENWLTDRRQRVVVNGETSSWASVTSGVPQGSVLGPLLFIIYINDIDVGIVSRIAKFADDTKLGGNASSIKKIEELHSDLIKIGEWSERWQMPFNLDKCKVMHIGPANPRTNYSLLGRDITSTDLEKDLGVLISSDLKFSKQCIEVEKKAQRLLGYIKRQFRYRNKEIVLTLYNSLVRPHLEYAVQFWSPTLKKDIVKLERVQARATKLIPSIRHMGYQRRLKALGLFTLETRRLRGQLIEVFKILRGFENIDYQRIFSLNTNATRNHGWKLDLKRFHHDTLGNFFTYKICNTWNGLPAEVVDSSSIEQFKSRLDKVLFSYT